MTSASKVLLDLIFLVQGNITELKIALVYTCTFFFKTVNLTVHFLLIPILGCE